MSVEKLKAWKTPWIGILDKNRWFGLLKLVNLVFFPQMPLGGAKSILRPVLGVTLHNIASQSGTMEKIKNDIYDDVCH